MSTDKDTPEFKAIMLSHKKFQEFAALSLEQGVQIYSLLHALTDLLAIALKGQGYNQEQIDLAIEKRTEQVRKQYEENAENLKNKLDALLGADKSNHLM